jgi:hypothetical protein
MSEMVEKVSAAIAEAQARGFNGPEVLARVAITAMLEPTPGMIDAADAERFGMSGITENSLVAVYEQMIEAALRDKNIT